MATQDFSFDLAAVLPLCISYGVAMEFYQHTTYLLTGSELNNSRRNTKLIYSKQIYTSKHQTHCKN